jgi:uncharacterized membrane protein
MTKSPRIESIDLLRGFVMVLMALDHVRDYFHADAFLYDPLDLSKTSVILFFTRFITHYCAPVFVFLAGTSAYLVGVRKGKNELTEFLVKRGLWLIFLELTVINFAWFFNIHFYFIPLIVIWALGVGMIFLAGASRLPWQAILVIGIILTAGHNLFDGFHVEGQGGDAIAWSILHDPNVFRMGSHTLFIGYPVISWIGVMFLGYCFGKFYEAPFDEVRRKKMLSRLGFGLIGLFIVIRLINVYGDPNQWTSQSTATFTFLSFLNVTKYPPSLLYLLVTLGPAILFLAYAENIRNGFSQIFVTLGRVPLFYYVLHIYFIHLFAMAAAVATGYNPGTMVFDTWVGFSKELTGYGFSLGVVYLVWLFLLVCLYPLCRWFERYKMEHREQWWLSYF